MGLAGNVALDELVASKILDWYAEATRRMTERLAARENFRCKKVPA
jgi:hypothetical protein